LGKRRGKEGGLGVAMEEGIYGGKNSRAPKPSEAIRMKRGPYDEEKNHSHEKKKAKLWKSHQPGEAHSWSGGLELKNEQKGF